MTTRLKKRRCNIKRLLLVVAVSICFTASVFAQAAEQAKKDTTAQAAGQPQQIMVKTIFAYQKELGLSEQQVKTLKDILSKFQDYLDQKRKEVTARRNELNDLISKRADLKAIKKAIDQLVGMQGDISYTDVETARKVEGALTSIQLGKWRGIQEQARKEAEQALKKAQEQAKAK